MNSFLDQLEAQLQAAARARTAGSRARMRVPWGWLRTGTRVTAVLTALAVTVGVAIVAFTIGSHAHRVVRSNVSTKPSASTAKRRGSHPARIGRVRFLAVQQLASGKLSGGETFDIGGELYRFQGRVYFAIYTSVNAPGAPPGGGGGGSFNPAQTPGVLAWEDSFECPHPHGVLVDGLLRDQAAWVLARYGSATTALRQVHIPPVFGVVGDLVYAVLPRPPRELEVMRYDGHGFTNETFAGNTRMCSSPNPVGPSP
jgi:hypothetical protein